MTNALPETVDGLPNLCGSEDSISEAIAAAAGRPVYRRTTGSTSGASAAPSPSRCTCTSR